MEYRILLNFMLCGLNNTKFDMYMQNDLCYYELNKN